MLATHNTTARGCLANSFCWARGARRPGWAWALWLVVAAAFTPLAVQAQTGAVINREYAIKAAFLYHFLNYVQWPAEVFEEEDAPFVIGVHMTNPFGDALQHIAENKKVAGRSIEIWPISSAAEADKCHILFVPKSVPASRQDALLKAARGSHILTVGETDDFIQRGGAAQFFLEGNKVRFAFNTDAIAAEKFKVSSKLLALAKIVSTQ